MVKMTFIRIVLHGKQNNGSFKFYSSLYLEIFCCDTYCFYNWKNYAEIKGYPFNNASNVNADGLLSFIFKSVQYF